MKNTNWKLLMEVKNKGELLHDMLVSNNEYKWDSILSEVLVVNKRQGFVLTRLYMRDGSVKDWTFYKNTINNL